jgi:hypothetical protein
LTHGSPAVGTVSSQIYRRAALIAALFPSGCATLRPITPPSLQLEAPTPVEVRYVFYLLHADAQGIADTLVELLDASRRASITRNFGYGAFMTREFWAAQKSGSQLQSMETRIVADPRTNSVVITVLASRVDEFQHMRDLVRRLDQDV